MQGLRQSSMDWISLGLHSGTLTDRHGRWASQARTTISSLLWGQWGQPCVTCLCSGRDARFGAGFLPPHTELCCLCQCDEGAQQPPRLSLGL